MTVCVLLQYVQYAVCKIHSMSLVESPVRENHSKYTNVVGKYFPRAERHIEISVSFIPLPLLAFPAQLLLLPWLFCCVCKREVASTLFLSIFCVFVCCCLLPLKRPGHFYSTLCHPLFSLLLFQPCSYL